MKFISGAVLAAAMLAGGISSASAGIVSVSLGAPNFLGNSTAFDTQTLGQITAVGFSEGGAHFSNTGGGNLAIVAQGSNGDGANPAGFPALNQYLSVLNAGNLSVTFALTSAVSFFWGSVDASNEVQFWNGSTQVGTWMGSDLTPALNADGNQGSPLSNRYVTLSNTDFFNKIVLTSGQNSFEIDSFAVAAIPEASTWAMMILGFLGLGFLGYRKSSKISGPALRVA